MTATILNKYKTVLYDKKGKPVIVQLDLRNKMMKMAYEKAMEEMEDMLDAEEAMRRDDDDTISWKEVKSSLNLNLTSNE